MALLAIKFNSRRGFGVNPSTGFKYANIQVATIAFLIICVVLIAKQLSIITWQLLPSVTPTQSLVLSISSDTPNTNSDGQDLWSQLSNLHLFGVPPKRQVTAIQPANVPVSRMAAKITGLVASSNPEHSFVILRQGIVSNTYRIGEQLQNQRFRIESIDHDRVIIRDGSRFESLLMYPDEQTKNKFGNQNTIANIMSSDRVSQIPQTMTDFPTSLADVINVAPIKNGKVISGYRVNPGKNPVYFSRFGLQPNDIAVALNGYDLTNSLEAMKVFSQLSTLKQASLTVIRNGQRLDIDLSS